MTTFGAKMRALMTERGLSLRALARATHYDHGFLSKVSRDIARPSREAAHRLDEALGAGGELAALRPARSPGITPDEHERLTLAVDKPSRLDRDTVDALAAVLASQRRVEDILGASGLVAPMRAQLNALAAMLRFASGPYRDPLARVVAEWTCYTGWLHAAVRSDVEALSLFGQAEEIADDVGDGTVAAVATSFRGYVARQQGRSRAVVRASYGALATPGGHESQRTFDRLQAAQGYAALGQRDDALRLLDEAAAGVDSAEDPPPATYWYSPPFFRMNIGLVHHGIGAYSDAADLIGGGLAGLPSDQRDAEWATEYRDALEDAKARA